VILSQGKEYFRIEGSTFTEEEIFLQDRTVLQGKEHLTKEKMTFGRKRHFSFTEKIVRHI